MNRPDRTNPSNNRHPETKSHAHEKTFCSLILLIGCVGLLYILSTSQGFCPTVDRSTKLVTQQSQQAIQAKPANFIASESDQELLQISGDFEAEEVMVFHIPNFHNSVSYELDLGNKQTIPLHQSTQNYRYPKSGRYTISLWGTYKHEKKLLFRSKIKISEPIEVAEEAFDDLDD
jgi:hypothetical protein